YFNSLRVPPYQGPALKYSLDKDWIEKELQKNKGVIPLNRMIEVINQDLKANNIDLATIREQYDPADLEDTYHTYFRQDHDHTELSKLEGNISILSGNLGDLYMFLAKKNQVRYHSDNAELFGNYQVRLASEAVANMYQLMTQEQLFIVPDVIDINTH